MFVKGEFFHFFKANFLLANEHKIPLSDIYKMIPYEREILIKMLSDHIDEKNQKIIDAQNKMKNRR